MASYAGEKRSSIRMGFKTRVLFGTRRPPEFLAHAKDISGSGLCLATDDFMDEGTLLHMVIKDENGFYKAVGMVTRCSKKPHVSRGGEMGVRFIKVNEELIDIYNQMLIRK